MKTYTIREVSNLSGRVFKKQADGWSVNTAGDLNILKKTDETNDLKYAEVTAVWARGQWVSIQSVD